MLVGASWVGRKIRETSGVTDIHIYGGLSARNYDVAGLKSSSIPPVRSLEAWGVRGKSLRTCQKIPAFRLTRAYPLSQAVFRY